MVWIYDKLHKYAKKTVLLIGTLRREETPSLSCACLKSYPCIIKQRSWINQKGQKGESYPETINFSARSLRPPFPPSSPLFPIMHLGGEVNFRKRGSQFSVPLSHRHQTLHGTLREVKFTKGGAHSPSDIPLPLPLHTHTHARARACAKPLIHPWVQVKFYIKGYICHHPANDSRSGGNFPKRLWRCVVGGYNKMIWFC